MNVQIPTINDSAPLTNIAPAGAIERGDLIAQLATLPEKVALHATRLAGARARYARRASRLSILALELPLFEDKKAPRLDGESKPMRAAANEQERELAIKYALENDLTLRHHRAAMEDAQRVLNVWRSREKNYRMIGRLLIAASQE